MPASAFLNTQVYSSLRDIWKRQAQSRKISARRPSPEPGRTHGTEGRPLALPDHMRAGVFAWPTVMLEDVEDLRPGGEVIAPRIRVALRDPAVADGKHLKGLLLRGGEAANLDERFVRDLLPPWDDPACGVQVGEVARLQQADVLGAEDFEEGALVNILPERGQRLVLLLMDKILRVLTTGGPAPS